MSRNILTLMGLRIFLKSNPAKHNQMQWAVAPKVELDPEHRSQDIRFTCGTTACAAGWTSLLAGDVLADAGSYDHEDANGMLFYRVGQVMTPEGEEVPIGQRAMELLGLDSHVAKALFHNKNSKLAVLKALKMLIDGKVDDEVIDYLGTQNHDIFDNPLESLRWG